LMKLERHQRITEETTRREWTEHEGERRRLFSFLQFIYLLPKKRTLFAR